jgi:hypothetical protein
MKKASNLLLSLGLLLVFSLAGTAFASVFETFTGYTQTAYGNYDYNGFHLNNAMADSVTSTMGGGYLPSNAVRLRNVAGSYLEYVGTDGNGKDGGVGTISFLYRAWDNSPAAVYDITASIDGGAYTAIGTQINTTTYTPYQTWTYDLNSSSNNIKIKVTNVSGERLHVDDFSIADYTGGGDVTPPSITSITVGDNAHLDVLFSEAVELTTAETEAYYVVTPGSVVPSSALRDGSNIALVHLTFASALPQGADTLTVNSVQDTSVNHNACVNARGYFTGPSPDTTPPSITSLSLLSRTTIDLLFSEPVDQTTAETESNYSVRPGSINPSAAVRDGSNIALVHLTFASSLPTGHDTLRVNAVQDTSANHNACSNLDKPFSVPLADVGDVVINEIMYDDTASTDVEWAELYNRTGSAIDLSYWLLLDAPAYPVATEGAFYLPTGTSIPAGGYLVVAKEAVPGIPSAVVGTAFFGGGWGLGNSGDNIGLYSDTTGGMRIDGYATANALLFYPDWSPANAGITLEKCTENSVWPADSTGWHLSTNWFSHTGRYRFCTPGTANTTCSDVTRPTIDSIIVQSNMIIDVVFTEPLRQDSAQIAAHYSVNLGINAPSLAALQTFGWNTVRLTFAAAMPANVYTLTVNNVMDLSNNAILANSTKQFTVGAPEFSIVFTEVMPNPATVADASGEWFEIYNAATSPVDMTNWQVTDGEGTFTISSASLASHQYFVFCCNADSATNGGVPENYVYPYAFGTGLQLANTADDITLRTAAGAVVASVAYTTAFPYGSGWSMQLKDPSYPVANDTSWCPATTAWLGSSGDFGTPGAASICPAPFVPDTVALCSLRVQDNCGVPTRNHVRQVVRGVFSYIDTCKASGYLQSGGCAVVVYGGALFDTMQSATRLPAAGDSVMIDGYITQFRGLTEISTYAGWTPIVTLLGTDYIVPPVEAACSDIGLLADSCRGENFESEMITVLNVQFVNPSGNFVMADSNYAVLCGGDTIYFRTDSCDAALIGTAIPTGAVNITGVLGQYDSSGCACQGYQILYGGDTPFAPAVCADPVSQTVRRIGVTDEIELRWQPGPNQTCTCYKVWSTSDLSNVFPTGWTEVATVNGVTNYSTFAPLSARLFYLVTANACP